MTRIAIRSGENTLAADLVTPRSGGTGAAILFLHGYASDRRSNVARAQAGADALGTVGLAADITGHGESPIPLLDTRPGDHLRDVLAAFDTLAAADGVDPARIGICGASYGAYLACLLIGHRPVSRLLLRAPALHVDATAPDPDGTRRHIHGLIEPECVLANLAAFDGPVLVLESERDEVVPRKSVEAYLAAARHGTHHVIPDALHALTDPVWNEAYRREVLAWFADL